MKKSLGDRMKSYELVNRSWLMPNSYAIVRIDGRAFHNFTRGLKKPFDYGLVEDMVETTKYLCKNVQGCHLGYTQSDEISLVLFDGHNHGSEKFFDGQIQKICSVVSSMTTAKFNQLRLLRNSYVNNDGCNVVPIERYRLAEFDARVFNLPTFDETVNYLRWRQRDAVKNSISMVAQSLYSHKELHEKNGNQQQELIFQKGQNWNDYDPSVKRGTSVVKRSEEYNDPKHGIYQRSVWVDETPDFCIDGGVEYLKDFIPPF